MTANDPHLLVIRFREKAISKLEAILLSPTSTDQPEVLSVPAVGAYRSSPAPNSEYSWLVGTAASEITVNSNNWVGVYLEEENVQKAWQLKSGLILEVAAAFRARIDSLDRRVDVVAVGEAVTGCSADSGKPTTPPRRPPGWLRLVLERLGWNGAITVLDALPREAEAVFDSGPAALPARERYIALVEKLGEMNAARVLFGQRRIEFSLGFVKSQSPDKRLVKPVVSKGEPLPVRSEVRLVLDEFDVASQELAFYWRPGDDSGMFSIVLGIPQKFSESPFATIPMHQLAASDPNGGVRLILEIDRFGRCYMTLRDEFDRLIDVVTPHPCSSDGSMWTAADPKLTADWIEEPSQLPANRIFLGSLFFNQVAKTSLQGWERLPGAMASTSYNGQSCEDYHLELQSRHRQGATTAGYEQDVNDTLQLHMQQWSEPDYAYLGERILKVQDGKSEYSNRNESVINSLIELVPQEMHHFRALLLSLPQSLEDKRLARN